jgi:PEP-CTERM motif
VRLRQDFDFDLRSLSHQFTFNHSPPLARHVLVLWPVTGNRDMNDRQVSWIAALSSSLLFATQAHAVEIIFTGTITSGVDNGAIFAPVGTNLSGDKISVTFDTGPVDPGTTIVDEFLGATVTVLGRNYDATDNDHATGLSIDSGQISGDATQTFDLGFSDTFAQVISATPFVPTGADLNSAFSYHVQPGDMANGFFNLSNDSFPGEGDFPPFGGPGSSTPWSDGLKFSVNNVFVNVPAPVPEPASWAMMVVGLGALGVAMRSRRKHLVVA